MLPIPKKIKLDAGDHRLAIDWSDGHRSLYPYLELRRKCPCATCTDAHGTGAARTIPPEKSSNPLQILEKPLRPERAELVGRYAVTLHWSDGHSSGIYSFEYLRGMCPCEECARART